MRCQELVLLVVTPGEQQDISVVPVGELGQQHQIIGTNLIWGGMKILPGQTQPFDPQNQVEGEQNNLKESYIGRPVVGRDLGQRVIVEQFADVFFDVGPLVVKEPHPPWAGFQVGHENVIGVL